METDAMGMVPRTMLPGATLVVPLDGSTFAERALRPAVAIATRMERARVLLVTCAPDDIDAAQQLLDDRASMYEGMVEIETRIIANGDPAAMILLTADSEPEGVLCMATHGKGGLRAKVLGSVSTEVVCGSRRPLLLVGPQCRTTLLPHERGRLVVCSDGSALSDRIIPTAAEWCERLDLAPWLTAVVAPDEDPEPVHDPQPNREVEAATRRLDALAAGLVRSSGSRKIDELPKTKVLHGTAASSLAWFAEQLPAALIAMATHGHSGLTRIAMGSVANDVVRNAPCPVLLTRPTDE